MKYVSIDIETTGLDPEQDQILEFGAVVEDTLRQDVPVEELPSFRMIIRHQRLSGSCEALAMNAKLIDEICNTKSSRNGETGCCGISRLSTLFGRFLQDQGIQADDSGIRKFVIAGKNYAGFDRLFLEKINGWKNTHKPLRRVLDPAILYFRPTFDEVPPSLESCLARAGLEPLVKHNAVDDARDVVRVLRYAFTNQFVRGPA